MSPHQLFLFGGSSPWTPSDWTASDDRVRGGSSQSHLTITPPSSTDGDTTARFHGTLDITTLGGAGFASQRTATSSRAWDLSAYDGVMLDVGRGDGKAYTFIVKDEILPPGGDGWEQSTISWEYDFRVGGGDGDGDGKDGGVGEKSEIGKRVWIPWAELKATYRGKEKKDAEPIDLAHLRRFSLMMRSFFGTQEGEFSLVVRSISAMKNTEKTAPEVSVSKEAPSNEKGTAGSRREIEDNQQDTGLLNWLSTMCTIS